MTLSAPHLLLLVSASTERQLRAFSCSPGALGTAHDGILGSVGFSEAQQSLSALMVHEPFPCLREPGLRQEEGPVDVNYWELCWLHSVAQKPLGFPQPWMSSSSPSTGSALGPCWERRKVWEVSVQKNLHVYMQADI